MAANRKITTDGNSHGTPHPPGDARTAHCFRWSLRVYANREQCCSSGEHHAVHVARMSPLANDAWPQDCVEGASRGVDRSWFAAADSSDVAQHVHHAHANHRWSVSKSNPPTTAHLRHSASQRDSRISNLHLAYKRRYIKPILVTTHDKPAPHHEYSHNRCTFDTLAFPAHNTSSLQSPHPYQRHHGSTPALPRPRPPPALTRHTRNAILLLLGTTSTNHDIPLPGTTSTNINYLTRPRSHAPKQRRAERATPLYLLLSKIRPQNAQEGDYRLNYVDEEKRFRPGSNLTQQAQYSASSPLDHTPNIVYGMLVIICYQQSF